MADQDLAKEAGAPVAKDAIDPDLVRLARTRPKIGLVTAAGVVFLCGFFLLRLSPDRRFGSSGTKPALVTVPDVLAGKVGEDRFVALTAEPVMTHAIRAKSAKGSLGMRVTPARGTGERLWIVLPGDGWSPSTEGPYVGRLRKLDQLPFAPAVAAFAASHPRPVFASAAAVREGFASGKVTTVGGDAVALADADRVAFDVVDPGAATIVAALGDRFASAEAWQTALTAAGITTTGAPRGTAQQVRFDVTLPDAVATVGGLLEHANLWAARVEPVTRHFETTWGALKASGPAGFTVADQTLPDAELDLVGLYVARAIPDGAYALLTAERPADYWYVLPITIVVAAIGLLFAWALARAVRRDLLPPRAA